jgi:hypothetical protein
LQKQAELGNGEPQEEEVRPTAIQSLQRGREIYNRLENGNGHKALDISLFARTCNE